MKENDTAITSEKESLDIELHLNEYDKGVMSDFQKQFLNEELAQLPPLEEGQVSINGIYTFDMGDKIEVSAYLRNGLSNQINFDKVPLVIVNKNGDILAKQTMHMQEFGILPSYSARAHKFYFDKENVFVDTIPMDDWKIQFENSVSAINTVKIEFEDMPESMDHDLKNNFIKFLDMLPYIKAGDVNVDVFKTEKRMDNSISIVVLIRNGCDKVINLEKLPILIEDLQGEIVAKGIFETQNVNVNPHKAKIYELVITEDYIDNKDYDINSCKVHFKA
ncbi:SLAP domain-containing protein [Clostridium bowmanii]|uniref:SLAP domain-containing protein n=1 Tax=Clostridium bowmanii TaxID=132925 RepID=UPI001C0D4122|nr:SLAP domain-containing protein [Clostridium bowmanii]MBU3190638.1 SLAP domain-containing protein [Clostridium bowmanii]MCA1072534.1 SLAP domain-containing protein [Clostridium bowmanii]